MGLGGNVDGALYDWGGIRHNYIIWVCGLTCRTLRGGLTYSVKALALPSYTHAHAKPIN